jgi:uncharacterized membrane protein YhaH (DUF805 family)
MDFDLNKAVQYFQTVVTQHYTDFRGRVSRRDFWTYIVVYVALAIIVAIVEALVGLGLLALLQLALFLPTAGMIARRLQDTGRNGSLVWLLMVPVLVMSTISLLAALAFGGVTLLLIYFFLLTVLSLISVCAAIYLIYVCIQPGASGPNDYGPPPAAGVPT